MIGVPVSDQGIQFQVSRIAVRLGHHPAGALGRISGAGTAGARGRTSTCFGGACSVSGATCRISAGGLVEVRTMACFEGGLVLGATCRQDASTIAMAQSENSDVATPMMTV